MISKMAYGGLSARGGGGIDFALDFLNSGELQPPFKF
jgi:hypothetical protein